MRAPTIFWGIVCVGSIGYLFKIVWENRLLNIRKRKCNLGELDNVNAYYHHEKDHSGHLKLL